MIDFNAVAAGANIASASKGVAEVYHDVLTAFMEQGFSEYVALDLTKHFMSTLMFSNLQGKTE